MSLPPPENKNGQRPLKNTDSVRAKIDPKPAGRDCQFFFRILVLIFTKHAAVANNKDIWYESRAGLI
jgi:hypothetical protein